MAESFPHTIPQAWLYVPFSGAQGVLALTLCVIDGQAILFEACGQLTCGDPESTSELTTPISGLTFARPGVYVVEALADGVAFARRELRVIAKAQATVYPAAAAPSASRGH